MWGKYPNPLSFLYLYDFLPILSHFQRYFESFYAPCDPKPYCHVIGFGVQAVASPFARLQVLLPEHFELREALPSEEEAQRLQARQQAEADECEGKGVGGRLGGLGSLLWLCLCHYHGGLEFMAAIRCHCHNIRVPRSK